MPSKRSLIVFLVGINVLLLAALVMVSCPPQAAYAQVGGRAGGLPAVTASVPGYTFHVLYVLDASRRKLHAFFPMGGRGQGLAPCEPRDLAADFGRK